MQNYPISYALSYHTLSHCLPIIYTVLQIGLGQLYYQGGRGVAIDYELAYHYFSQASQGGNANADGYLGKIYAEGSITIAQDYSKAFEYFSKAAEEVCVSRHSTIAVS